MLLGNLFAGFAIAAMAIAPVACAPTAEPEVATVVVKRTSIGDKARTCLSGVQKHCGNINNNIQSHGGVIDVTLAASIKIDLSEIVVLVTTLVGDITEGVLSQDDVQDCGPVYVSIVQLLTNLLISISGACQPGAITVLASVVLSLSIQIGLIASSLLTTIEGLLGLLLSLLGGILATLQGNINSCVSSFNSACGPFGGH
ncbi:hypothetical protein V8E51_014766 [Hyaloscypha variabilis]|uniref:Uncharacterized protein n=1 Tax=Hyaloscypha variabilis (strain UAMH 11265 / GT02V1 / F) TaxID=1149755 RepID=A0A2J6RD06_HYAVF|nr:hypothetical protein L207DRAFT_587394 [Hyaloscypha variabilis F]